MKKLILSTIMSVALVFTGCKSIPTPAEIETASYAIGVSTAMVCNMTKIGDKDRQVMIDIVGEIRYCCPTSGHSLVESWTVIASNHVVDLVKEKKITEAEAKVILDVFDTVLVTADYMVRTRWPVINERIDLAVSATSGFCNGFLAVFKPTNQATFSASVKGVTPDVRVKYDEETYNYLMSQRK